MASYGGINYKVCNIGSVYANANNLGTTGYMATENRFKYQGGDFYTSIAAYSTYGGIYNVSINSSGAATSAYGNISYYPAIDSQFALTPLIHVIIH